MPGEANVGHVMAAEILGVGAHRQLILTLPDETEACSSLPSSAAAHLCLEVNLPPALYFDPYEIDRGLPLQGGRSLARTEVDLETCVFY